MDNENKFKCEECKLSAKQLYLVSIDSDSELKWLETCYSCTTDIYMPKFSDIRLSDEWLRNRLNSF